MHVRKWFHYCCPSVLYHIDLATCRHGAYDGLIIRVAQSTQCSHGPDHRLDYRES